MCSIAKKLCVQILAFTKNGLGVLPVWNPCAGLRKTPLPLKGVLVSLQANKHQREEALNGHPFPPTGNFQVAPSLEEGRTLQSAFFPMSRWFLVAILTKLPIPNQNV